MTRHDQKPLQKDPPWMGEEEKVKLEITATYLGMEREWDEKQEEHENKGFLSKYN